VPGVFSPTRRTVLLVVGLHEFAASTLLQLLTAFDQRFTEVVTGMCKSRTPGGARVRRSSFAKPVLLLLGNPRVRSPDGARLHRSVLEACNGQPWVKGIVECPLLDSLTTVDACWSSAGRELPGGFSMALAPLPPHPVRRPLSVHASLRDLASEFAENPGSTATVFEALRKAIAFSAAPLVSVDTASFCGAVSTTDGVLELPSPMPVDAEAVLFAPEDAWAPDTPTAGVETSVSFPLASPDEAANCALYVYDTFRFVGLLGRRPADVVPSTVFVAFSTESTRTVFLHLDAAVPVDNPRRRTIGAPDHNARLGSVVIRPTVRAVRVIRRIVRGVSDAEATPCGLGAVHTGSDVELCEPHAVTDKFAHHVTVSATCVVDRTVTPPEDAACVANALARGPAVTGTPIVIVLYFTLAEARAGLVRHDHLVSITEGLAAPAVFAIVTDSLKALPYLLCPRPDVEPAPGVHQDVLGYMLSAAGEIASRVDRQREVERLERALARADRRGSSRRKKRGTKRAPPGE
jgi:hypothetical protein